jgi:valyl-tRNA synthetase
MAIYKLIYYDFASWLLEIVKPAYQEPIDSITYKAVMCAFEDILKVLHPFMPFITEEIWQTIKERSPEDALIVAQWPTAKPINEALISEFDFASEVVSGIRNIRKQKNIAFKDAIELHVLNNDKAKNTFDAVISKLGHISELQYTTEKVEGALTFRVKSNEYFVPMQGSIDVDA